MVSRQYDKKNSTKKLLQLMTHSIGESFTLQTINYKNISTIVEVKILDHLKGQNNICVEINKQI